MANTTLPILYSFRRCPYAIRARMAIRASGVKVELREIELKNKPKEMLTASSKGTVPVLIDTDGKVIDESLDIMEWALARKDPCGWLNDSTLTQAKTLIEQNDCRFKYWLDRYKYHVGYPEQPQDYYREQCETFFQELESRLKQKKFLLNEKGSLADIAIFPFIRQCAFVDKAWFDQAPYPMLQRWLQSHLDSDQFLSVMNKYDPWLKQPTTAVMF